MKLPATIIAAPEHDRMRLDVFVSTQLGAEYSRSRVARMIKAGLVTVNGATPRASSAVRAGDRIEIAAPAPAERAAIQGCDDGHEPPAIPVIFADGEIIVVDKPAGITVHPAPGHPDGTLVDALLARFPDLATMAEPDNVLRPGIVHRLDKDTSGVMVVARTPFARAALSRQFKDRTVRKTYLAIVRGIVARDRFTIDRPVGRHPIERKRMSIRSHAPRDAVSNVTVLHRFKPQSHDDAGSTLVRVRPATGRTHQIRVHLASIGHPCLGDSLYGSATSSENFARQALHALALEIEHPRTGKRHEFIAPLSDDFAAMLARHGVAAEAADIRRWIDSE
ncbi:MAG: RluA family pseudouridine synthase [Candidatus Binataceae bacterium]